MSRAKNELSGPQLRMLRLISKGESVAMQNTAMTRKSLMDLGYLNLEGGITQAGRDAYEDATSTRSEPA
jgi:hypothetical protein